MTVTYATADGTANAGTDYTAAADTLTFGPGQTSKTIPVLVHGNRLVEPDETFFVNVSSPNSYIQVSEGVGYGTIFDAEPRISVGDVWNYGETSFTFSVSLSVAYDQEVTVDFATVDGTAIAGVDYVATSGRLIFAPGETTWLITVEVIDPTSADKYFNVHLTGASTNALIANAWATGYWYYDYWYYDPGYEYYDWYYYHG